MKNTVKKYGLLIALLTLLISQGISLLNTSVVWDDWCIWNKSWDSFDALYGGVGAIYLGHFQYFIMGLTPNSVVLYRVLTILLYSLSTIAIYDTVKRIKIEGEYAPMIIATLFAVLPLNYAREIIVCFPYTVGLTFQVLAIWAFVKMVDKKSIAFRIVSLVMQWGAFMFLNSTLLFALGFYLLMAIKENNINKFSKENIKIIFFQLLRWGDFIILPFIFWVVRSVYWMPTGIYAEINYNKIGMFAIIKSPVILFTTFVQNISYLFFEPFTNLKNERIILLLLFLLLCYPLYRYFSKRILFESKSKIGLRLLYSGLFLFVIGIMPYILVGNNLNYGFCKSRNSILLLLGCSVIIYSLFVLIKNNKLKWIFILVLVSGFLANNIDTCITNLSMNQKNVALEQFFIEKRGEIGDNENILVADMTKSNKWLIFNFYHLSGISRKAIGKETRIVDNVQFPEVESTWHFSSNSYVYNIKDAASPNKYKYLLVVSENKGMKAVFVLKNSINYFLNKEKYIKKARSAFDIKIIPIE